MARYDVGATYDSGYIYDATVGVLTADEDVLAGESTAMPDRRAPWRDASATLWGFDPAAWLPTDPLAHVAIGATRSGALNETGRQTETLTFDIAEVLPDWLTEGAWLCVQWAVTTPSGSIAFLGGVFQVTNAPSPNHDAAGVVYHVVAVDWFSYAARAEVSASGWIGTGILIGSSPPEQLANFLGHYSAGGDHGIGAPLVFDFWTDWGVDQGTPGTGGFSQVTTAGTEARVSNLLVWFWLRTAGYLLNYAPDGGLWLQGKTPTDSGLYVTLDTVPLSSVPLPVETLTQQIAQPQFLTVQYRLFNTAGGASLFAEARGNAGLHDFTYESIDRVSDTGDHAITLGAWGSTDYVNWRLLGYLGAADTVTLTVDSAFPPPPLGRLVAVRTLPLSGSTQQVAGWYRLMGFTQPLHVGSATWTLEWWSAFP